MDVFVATPLREAILRIVHASPGIRVGEVIRQFGLPAGEVHRELSWLKDCRFVRFESRGRHRLTFPGERPAGDLAPMDQTAVRRIAWAIAEMPGARLDDLVERSGLNPEGAAHHVFALQRIGLVLAGNDTRLSPTTALLPWLREGRLPEPARPSAIHPQPSPKPARPPATYPQPPPEPSAWDALGGSLAREVAAALVQQPGAMTRDLSRAVGIAPAVTRACLNTLLDAGLVERVSENADRFVATPRLHDLLAPREATPAP